VEVHPIQLHVPGLAEMRFNGLYSIVALTAPLYGAGPLELTASSARTHCTGEAPSNRPERLLTAKSIPTPKRQVAAAKCQAGLKCLRPFGLAMR